MAFFAKDDQGDHAQTVAVSVFISNDWASG
jgi:hypothetical protein